MSDLVWIDGTLRPARDAGIDPADRGFLLGDGLFETMRVTNGTIPHRTRHFHRLCDSARILRFPTLDMTALAQGLDTVITANAIVNGSARLTLTRGIGPRGLMPPTTPRPTVLITTQPSPARQPGAARLHVSRQIRDGASPLSRLKTLNYLPGILAHMEAADIGADDGLLCNAAGRIASASAASLIVLTPEGLVTPALTEGAMAGISRACLVESGLVREGHIEPDFPQVSAAWIVNALTLRPVGQIGGRSLSLIPAGTERLRACVHPS